jgi:XapX domain-containing protein
MGFGRARFRSWRSIASGVILLDSGETKSMKVYIISLGAGLLVGIIYSLLNVRSPAPPLVALVGLFGILIGEQLIPVGKQMLTGAAITTAWTQAMCTQHIFGMLPGRPADQGKAVSTVRAMEKQI